MKKYLNLAKAVDRRRIASKFLADVNVISLELRASLRSSTYEATF